MDEHGIVTGTPMNGRRSALRTAGMGLAALAALPLLANDTDAKKRRKKRKKNAQQSGQGMDRCLPQVERCEKVLSTFCETGADPAQCRAALLPCCQPMGTCASDASLQCIFQALFTKM